MSPLQHVITIEQSTKMPPMILRPEDRPKIQDAKKIQDTNDLVAKKDTGGMANEDALLPTRR